MALNLGDSGDYKCAPECYPYSREMAGYRMRRYVGLYWGPYYKVDSYLVWCQPSRVGIDGDCTCYDFEQYGSMYNRPCKHIWAVIYYLGV